METNDIKEFYEEFSETLKSTDGKPNLRHFHIFKFLEAAFQMKKVESVLEIGCGIGIISKFLGKYVEDVTSIDISENNISYAEENVDGVKFICSDFLSMKGNKTFDLIALFDVIEHFPKVQLSNAFKKIKKHSNENTFVAINIPTAEFQKAYKEAFPDQLQIVDEGIEFDEMVSLASDVGLNVNFYQRYGIDHSNQYAFYLLDYKKETDLNNIYREKEGTNLLKLSSSDGRKKVAFFTGSNDHFLKDIIEHYEEIFQVYIANETDNIFEVIQWSDVSWFEWCENQLVNATRLPKVCKIVNRLHSYEAFSPSMQWVDWNKVDDLILVAPHMRDAVLSIVPNLSEQTNISLIPNGINLGTFRYKKHNKGLNLAYVGSISFKKNPVFLFQCMKALIEKDNRYKLYIAGMYEDFRVMLYCKHIIKVLGIESNVVLDGYVENMVGWLGDKSYIVSTSIWEGCPLSILEAMSRGIKPVIHNWYGAEALYPKELLFATVEEFVKQVMSDSYDSEGYRIFVENNYSLESQLVQIDEIME